MFCTRALMTQQSCAVGMRNAKPGNHLNQKPAVMYLESKQQPLKLISREVIKTLENIQSYSL